MDKNNRWINVMDKIIAKPPTVGPKPRFLWVEERLLDLVNSIDAQLKDKGCDEYVKRWIDELVEVKNLKKEEGFLKK